MTLVVSHDTGDCAPAQMVAPFDWESVTQHLHDELGAEVYSAWLLSLKYETYNRESGIITVSVATTFLRRWIIAHYEDALQHCMACAGGLTHPVHGVHLLSREEMRQTQRRDVAPVVPKPETTPAPAAPAAGRYVAPPPDPYPGFALHPDFTFATFRVTEQHRLAYTVVQFLLSRRSDDERRLLAYIHGASGAGKTHLVQAFARECLQQGRIVRSWSAATAAASSVFALEAAAKSVLIIDNVDYGNHYDSSLTSVLEQAYARNDQVLITGSLPVGQLRHVPDQVRNRLTAGLGASIDTFADAAKRAVLDSLVEKMRVRNAHFKVPSLFFEKVVEHLPGNGHALEGFVLRVFTHHLANGRLPNEREREALVESVSASRAPKRLQVSDIQRYVCNHYGLSRQDLVSQRRHRMVTLPRQVGMYLCKHTTTHSLTEIGRRFGDRDHTTVLHAIRKVEALRNTNPEFSKTLDELKKRIRPESE